jgi:hypothetical protein
VTWLVWRRYRLTIGAALAVLAALALWMAWQVHLFDVARQSRACVLGFGGCAISSNRIFSLNVQVSLVNLVLLAVPCALGVVLGAPLVAGELEHRTNRLVWTQGVSRTRWLLTKWVLLLVPVGVVMAVLTVLSQWWSGHVAESTLLLHVFPSGRMGPGYFPVTGVVATAYAAFAFSLGTAVGAFVRRTGWAVFATVVLYVAIAVFMVLVVRPNLEPQLFVPFDVHTSHTASGAESSQRSDLSVPAGSWDLGFGYRDAPGWQTNEAESAGAVAQACQARAESGSGVSAGVTGTSTFFGCLAQNHVQWGELYQSADHYWSLQWRESAILIAAAALCLGGTVIAVRRWRA